MIPILALLGMLTAPLQANAWTVSSGFTHGCHEEITWNAFHDFLYYLPPDGVPVSDGTIWRELAIFLLEESPIDIDPDSLDDADRFFLVSLIVGVRSPDTDGHSIINLGELRKLHSDPTDEGQYAHALRGKGDDLAEGNAVAVEGLKTRIADLLRKANDAISLPADEQIILGRFYLDFYGEIDVEVWAPMYYIGQAAHALQDSFSHTIRDDADGLRTIVHVMNYVDAIGSNFDEDVSGLAHSDSMDDCLDAATTDTFAAAIEATIDLFYIARAVWTNTEPDAVQNLFDKWFLFREGCDADNDYCDNGRWLEQTQKHQTKAYFKQIIDCRQGGGPLKSAGWALLVLCALAGAARISRRRREGTRSP